MPVHLRQVIGPEAAQAWLAEVALPLGLHYHFAHCHGFDTKPGLARPWLLKHLGARLPVALGPFAAHRLILGTIKLDVLLV